MTWPKKTVDNFDNFLTISDNFYDNWQFWIFHNFWKCWYFYLSKKAQYDLVPWLVPLSDPTNNQNLYNTTEWTWRLVSFETFDQSDEETWLDQNKLSKTNTKTMTIQMHFETKTNAFWEHLLSSNGRPRDSCDLWDIWSEWSEDMTWTKNIDKLEV